MLSFVKNRRLVQNLLVSIFGRRRGFGVGDVLIVWSFGVWGCDARVWCLELWYNFVVCGARWCEGMETTSF